MYEKYTPVRQQALFAPFIQISVFYSFLFKGRGVIPPLFGEWLCQAPFIQISVFYSFLFKGKGVIPPLFGE